MVDDDRIHDVEKEEHHDIDHEELIRALATSGSLSVVTPIIAKRAVLLEGLLEYLFLIAFSLLGWRLGLWFGYRNITPESKLLSLRTFFYGFLTILLSASGGVLYLVLKLW